jgi:UDP-N-acetylglucosamine--N-acetylmuramyl-(pentapeptide) pyrophosphoryl-undecaprenol N-acetylglucosamine transferase
MKKQNLLIAGGGTGGHIAPALAVGNRASDDFNVFYACTPRPVDKTMYKNANGPVHVMNPPRIDRGMKVLLPFTALRALISAVKLLKKNNIHVVLGTGGYSSYFAVVAAWLLRKPAALLETNAIPGKSNRFASRFCREAYTGFSGGASGLHCIARHTGTPVSDSFTIMEKAEARKALGVPVDKPVILFLGGSQGAAGINDLALGIHEGVTVLLQCGTRDYQRVRKLAQGKQNTIVEPFIGDLSQWYSAAELAVARAGGQTIAELSVFRLPAVLIPFPFAAEDHQTANAAVVEMAGAAILRQQEGLSSDMLSALLLRLISKTGELDEMKTAMAAIYPPEPAGRIAEHLRELSQ